MNIVVLFCFLSLCCNNVNTQLTVLANNEEILFQPVIFPGNSWQHFLQHLPMLDAPVRDYTGNIISNQEKHFAIINYDVGNSDLQQCADALIRLRAEHLFKQERFNEIGFHFFSGQYYSFNMYCTGVKPVLKSNALKFVFSGKNYNNTHESLRNYLDIVYMYANTISLCKELKPSDDFEVGTVIITPGSPGHACIIIDEKKNSKGEKLYKLAESYMPAQSIYVLSNIYDDTICPWYKLNRKEILTSSYRFTNFQLKKFE